MVRITAKARREHAAINPMYLGVKAVIAKSMARIHRGNLVNHGVVPLRFADSAAYDGIDQGDELAIHDFRTQLPQRKVTVQNLTKGTSFDCEVDVSDEEIDVLLAGGRLRYVKAKQK